MSTTVVNPVDQVLDWIEANWATDISVGEWWRRLADARYSVPTWPEPYGLCVDATTGRAIHSALTTKAVIAPPSGGVGADLAGPTLLAHGTQEQRERFLPPLLPVLGLPREPGYAT